VLRIYTSKNLVQVQAEVALLRHIGPVVPCATVQPSLLGEDILSLNGHPVLLFNFIKGKHIARSEMDEKIFENIGAYLKTLHSRTRDRNVRRYFDVSDVIYNADMLLRIMKGTPSALGNFLGQEIDLAGKLQMSIAGEAMLHGDVDERNLIFSSRRKIIFIDWDDASFGPPQLDLAIVIRNLVLKRLLRNPDSTGISILSATNALFRGYGAYASEEGFGHWLRFSCFRYFVLMLRNWLGNLDYDSRTADNHRLYLMACGYEKVLNDIFHRNARHSQARSGNQNKSRIVPFATNSNVTVKAQPKVTRLVSEFAE
jgi:Ser/Thr protein kinase RdoA (MazF antagonist)